MAKATYKPSDPELQEICKLIEDASGRFSKREIFSDLIELMACTIAKESDSYRNKEREKIYQQIIKKHGEDASDSTHYMGRIQFHIMNTILKARESKDIMDVFGPLYSAMNMDGHLGQFFTPWHISHAMARMLFSKEEFEQRGYQTLCEPTCGAGGMILAAAQVLNEFGHDYKEKLIVQASDIDNNCAMMCYIQCSLYQIPAVVLCMNALEDPNGDNARDIWTTPVFFQMGWPKKLGLTA